MEAHTHGGDVYGLKGIEMDFSVNLNPLGMPVEVKCALAERLEEYARYPDWDCRELRSAIAAREGVAAESILCGNGAADLIYRLCFGLKPKTVLVCAPTFSEYAKAARIAGGAVRFHHLAEAEGFAVTERILQDISKGPELVFLCNPNNPTGRLVPGDLLKTIAAQCDRQGALLVVDECFLDFTAGVSAKQWMDQYQNFVILKAFTKNYAMAGLRLGYLMTRRPAVLEAVRVVAPPWSVSAPAQIGGVAALSATGFLEETRALVARERSFLAESIRRFGLKVYPGEANFLLCKSGQPLQAALMAKGILIRSCGDYVGLDDRFVRICVKTRPENERLLAALQEVFHG